MTEKIKNDRLYWICQISGWLTFYIIYTSIAIFFAGLNWMIIIGYFNTVIVGFLLTHQYKRFIHKKQWTSLGINDIAIRIIFCSFAIGAIWASVVLPVNDLISEFFPADKLPRHQRELTMGFVILMAFNLGIIILIWSLIYFTYKYFNNFKQAEVDKWKLEAAVKDAQLLALKSQINPHFMFNCLNNIRSLVIENPEKARDMILHLSDLLRYSLQFSNKEKINLEDEMEIVKNYLNLESIQYEDRLQYRLNIQENTLEMKIPPMAVQLLVENAIKYGISLLPEGGEININSRLENNILVVEVVNTGQLINKDLETTGIGLQNAAERLKLLFGQLAVLTIINKDAHHVEAKFQVPILY